MIGKLRLNLSNNYEVVIATKELCHMLVAYIEGRPHHLALGRESGDIQTWDDFVINRDNGVYQHYQVKRQETPFSEYKCNRNLDPITKTNGDVELRDLSPLDKTMKELADWVSSNDPATVTPPKKFSIELPSPGILIKKDLEVRNLNTLCDTHIKATTTAADMIALAINDTSVANAYQWLTTWCGFGDWDHILKAFKHLSVSYCGEETAIYLYCDEILARVFNDVVSVRRLIKEYIEDASNFPNKITPRTVLASTWIYLRPEIPKWTQFAKDQAIWNISGIHDSVNIETAYEVVTGVWGDEFRSSLKLNADPSFYKFDIVKAIIRLAVHVEKSADFHVPNKDAWTQTVLHEIGQTLGTSKTDCQKLPFYEYSAFSSSDIRALDSLKKQDDEAKDLHAGMHKVTFLQVCRFLEDNLLPSMKSDLRDAVEAAWKEWKVILASHVDYQTNFFIGMLHPKAEGFGVFAEARVGSSTVELLAIGLQYYLIVCVAMGIKPNDFASNDQIDIRALATWSGPHGSERSARKLTEKGISDLLGNEVAPILILPALGTPNVEFNSIKIGEDKGSQKETLAKPTRPKCIITSCLTFTDLIEKGNISEIKNFIDQEIKLREEGIQQQIEQYK